MAYSIVGVANMALSHLGQPKIASLTESASAPAVVSSINVNLPFVIGEILESADWVFAKTRVTLEKNSTTPVQGFLYAYTLPADFVRPCRQRKDDPPVYPDSVVTTPTYFHGYLYNEKVQFNYVVETLADGTKCLFTDYDNSTTSLVYQYIRREENPARWSAHFCNTVAVRLAAALAPVLTSVKSGMDDKMWRLYATMLKRAKGHNASHDFLKDETGSTDWEIAGRNE